jgi:proton-translocating NADH-quinone oxidoreductase chain N
MDVNTAFTWLLMVPMISSAVIYLIGRIFSRGLKNDKKTNPAKWLALIALLVTGIFLYFIITNVFSTGQTHYQNFGDVWFRFDGISMMLSLLVLVLGILVTIYSFTYMGKESGEEKFYALLVMMIGAINGLGCALDLFNLWVWFEVMTISSIVLVAFYKDQAASLEAGVKYLIQSATGSVMVVIGIALIFLETGTLNIEMMRMSINSPSPFLIIGGALLVIGFGVKIAMVPLHTWLPDAHSQAPSGISAMLSGVVIEVGLIALLRALGGIALSGGRWGYLLIGFGVLNMIVGNLLALRQKEVKRLLAYSSLSHVGYMLLGFGVLISLNGLLAGVGAVFHLITHGLMKSLAFLAAGVFLYNFHISKGSHKALVLDDLNGASKKYPFTAFAFSVALLSLGGLPPLAGFMSKWQLLAGIAQTQNTIMIILVIFAGLMSVLSLGYYAPLVNRMYRKEPADIVMEGESVSIWMYIPLALLTLAVVVLGFVPSLLYWLTGPAGYSLFIFFGQ